MNSWFVSFESQCKWPLRHLWLCLMVVWGMHLVKWSLSNYYCMWLATGTKGNKTQYLIYTAILWRNAKMVFPRITQPPSRCSEKFNARWRDIIDATSKVKFPAKRGSCVMTRMFNNDIGWYHTGNLWCTYLYRRFPLHSEFNTHYHWM